MNRLYIGNLPRDVENAEVDAAFARFGDIANLWVARNPPGFAYIVSSLPARLRRAS